MSLKLKLRLSEDMKINNKQHIFIQKKRGQ